MASTASTEAGSLMLAFESVRLLLMTIKTSVRIEPLTPTIGALVEGADLRGHLDDETVACIRQALLDHGVIFFHDQPLTPDELKAFALKFGPIGSDTPGGPPDEVAEMITTEPRGTTDIWHADATYMEAPNLGAVMQAVRLPPVGGDTCWASMNAAYDALSQPMRTMLDGLTALHSLFPVMERLRRLGDRFDGFLAEAARGGYPEHIHPVVRVHPENGRKLLFVNSSWTTHIVELEPAESAKILGLLFDHVKLPDFNLRFRWSPGDIAFWDNRAVQHYAVPDYSVERVMNRVVIAGDRAFGPAG
jgi:alpha-ketoglutarate-dependent taurine dioxygenase